MCSNLRGFKLGHFTLVLRGRIQHNLGCLIHSDAYFFHCFIRIVGHLHIDIDRLAMIIHLFVQCAFQMQRSRWHHEIAVSFHHGLWCSTWRRISQFANRQTNRIAFVRFFLEVIGTVCLQFVIYTTWLFELNTVKRVSFRNLNKNNKYFTFPVSPKAGWRVTEAGAFLGNLNDSKWNKIGQF